MDLRSASAPMVLLLTALAWGCVAEQNASDSGSVPDPGSTEEAKVVFRVFKTPFCGCCSLYIDYLKEEGFEVETVDIEDPARIKKKYKIPPEMQSCHTATVQNYFVEGHVPVETLRKLLREKPRVDGIALPGMPSGSPGMPGPKNETFIVYALTDGKSSVFMAQ